MRKIAVMSEHASRLATSDGTDGGAQNVYVTDITRQLTRLGQIDGLHRSVLNNAGRRCERSELLVAASERAAGSVLG